MSASIILAGVALLASAALTRLAIAYAQRRRMLDLPGARRSHDRPTPRGGGIAPVAVVLGGGTWLALAGGSVDGSMVACLGGLAAVAAVGWIDDHRPLSPLPRLAVHLLAAAIAVFAATGIPQAAPQLALSAVLVFLVAGLVNAWNFMDGIDGLATTQALLVMVAVLCGGWTSGAWLGLCALSVAALAGFLPFNAPRARIFLGDVGSGALGYLVAFLLLHAAGAGGMPWPLAVLLPSAFLIDAGMTLLTRMAAGRRWWRPHREHLYQWLVRRGRTHFSVTCSYAMWTLFASAVALSIASRSPAVGLAVTIVVIISGQFLWCGSRKRLWSGVRSRR